MTWAEQGLRYYHCREEGSLTKEQRRMSGSKESQSRGAGELPVKVEMEESSHPGVGAQTLPTSQQGWRKMGLWVYRGEGSAGERRSRKPERSGRS